MTAPAPAAVVRDFVNSFEPQTDEESWGTPAALQRWLTDHQYSAGVDVLDATSLQRARDLREGLRSVLIQHAGHEASHVAVERMRSALASVAPVTSLGTAGTELVAAGGTTFDLMVLRLVDAVRRCETAGIWDRLKACERSSCQWAYYDSSRNHSRRWCSMEGCGNVLKMQRRAARTSTGPERRRSDVSESRESRGRA